MQWQNDDEKGPVHGAWPQTEGQAGKRGWLCQACGNSSDSGSPGLAMGMLEDTGLSLPPNGGTRLSYAS